MKIFRIDEKKTYAQYATMIARTWSEIVRHLKPATSHVPSYGVAMRVIAEHAEREQVFNGCKSEACKLAILLQINSGVQTRDGIVASVPRICGASHRQAAFLLDAATGNDPKSCLWVKGEDGKYALLN